jgi:hypothetical protein
VLTIPNIYCKRGEMRVLHGIEKRKINLTEARARTIANRGFAP